MKSTKGTKSSLVLFVPLVPLVLFIVPFCGSSLWLHTDAFKVVALGVVVALNVYEIDPALHRRDFYE